MLPTPALPSAVADVLAAAQGLGAAAGTGAGPVGAEERAAWLAGLRQIVDTTEAVFTHVLAEFDSAGDGQTLHGAASTASWLRGALGLAGGEASERVRIARAGRAELATALTALADPAHPASYDHVQTVHRTVRALPPSVRHDAATHLTRLANQLGVDDLRAAGRHLRHVVDPDGSARHVQEDYGSSWRQRHPHLPRPSGADPHQHGPCSKGGSRPLEGPGHRPPLLRGRSSPPHVAPLDSISAARRAASCSRLRRWRLSRPTHSAQADLAALNWSPHRRTGLLALLDGFDRRCR